MDLDGRRGGQKLEGVEGKETIISIYYINLFENMWQHESLYLLRTYRPVCKHMCTHAQREVNYTVCVLI